MVIAGLLLLAASCATAADLADHKRLSTYDFDASRPLVERVAPMPERVLALWRETDASPGYANYALTPSERAEFAAAVDALPPRLKEVLRERLIAFYFISGLMGNGLTEWVLDERQRTHFYIGINPSAFGKTLSQLLSDRERSVFRGMAAVAVDAGPGGSGIIYTVAHEAAHAFDYAAGLTRFTEPVHARVLGRSLEGGWDVWRAYDAPLLPFDFPARRRLRFYGFAPPELEAWEAPEVCRQLAASPFSSLYGTRNWADDAAELFLFDHLTRTLGRPYRYHCAGETVEMDTPARRARARAVLQDLAAPQ